MAGYTLMVPSTIGASSIDLLKIKHVITDDRVRLAVNTFLLYKAPSPDGIYLISLQKRLNLIIKYLS